MRVIALVAGVGLVLWSTAALAHGGGLDAYGCHHDRKRGGYHCHRGEFAGQSFSSQQEMLQKKQREAPPAKKGGEKKQ